MNEQKIAIDYLSKNYILNIDMIECINRKTAQLIKVTENGVLLFNSDVYMMSTEDENTASEMLDIVEKAELFVAHQDLYILKAQEKFKLSKKMIVHQAAYLSKELITLSSRRLEIRQLDESHAAWIIKNYSHAEDEDYVIGRIKAGMIYGAFINGNPAGFIGVHAEGSIGMLEVLPEYRREGIAFELEAYMVNKFLKQGFMPYSQIVVGNKASIELHKKLDFSISDKKICWLML